MKILVVEDDPRLSTLVKDGLTAYSHTVEVAGDGAEGLFLAKSYPYDAIVLDNNLPKKDGLTVCDELRQNGNHTPILFLSIDAEHDTKLEAFRRGADDYLTKPFAVDELRARIDAITRRGASVRRSIVSLGNLTVDFNTHAVTRGAKTVQLTRKEFNLLEFLLNHAGMVVSRAELMEHVWTSDGNPFSNTVESHISSLRTKLNAGGEPNLIFNIPGRGYVIRESETLRN